MSNRHNTKWLIEKSKSLFGDLFDYENSSYLDAKTMIKFRCKKHNYSFEQTSNNHFNSKYPCKKCLLESKIETFTDGLEIFKQKIKLIHGDLFTFENALYVNQRTPICLTCSIHKKSIIKEPQVFLRGHGCDLCYRERASKELSSRTLFEKNSFVSKLNGRCLSINYFNNEEKLEFQCEAGHQFKKSWSEVKNSLRWCPKCSPNKLIGESLARLILEHLLKIKLPSVYLKQMEGLQLDGYNDLYNIAFEYQGYQHYTKDSHFHSSNHRYEAQQNRDNFKKSLCLKNGITLIEIYEFKTIRSGRIEIFVQYVKEKLDELNIKYTNEPFELDLVDLYRGRKSTLFEKAKRIVEKNKGKLQEFIGTESKHTYTCQNGHKITNRILSVIINSNASCPYCDLEKKYNELQSIIDKRGGKLLIEKLNAKGLSEKYKWICDKGHLSETKGQYLYNGHWCANCQRDNKTTKLTDDELDKLKRDVKSGLYYQKDIPVKYGISPTVYRRIIKELKLIPNYIPQDRKSQIKKTKGQLFQINPNDFTIIKKFESLEDVKNHENGIFKPEGIRLQMKKYKKAYGFFWSREDSFEETVKIIKQNKLC